MPAWPRALGAPGGSSGRDGGPRRCDVQGDLADQRVDGLKTLLATQARDERDPPYLAVEVVVEVEQVRLDEHVGVVLERRPTPYGDRCCAARAVRARPGPRVDPPRRDREPRSGLEVGGGEPEVPSTPVAPDHRALELMGPAEHRGGRGNVPSRHELADPRRRDRRAVGTVECNGLDAEAARGRERLEQADATAAAAAQSKVLPHDDRRCAKLADEDLFDERGGLLG